MPFDHRKYQPIKPVKHRARCWPDRVIEQAPQWCSVDLRDGNQALIEPMTVAQKCRLFDTLINIGFKEIEVGFPAASQQDFDFVRRLIDEERIPDDVTIQVLTQARQDLISRSFEALAGAPRAIMHVYNSTSVVQRERVFKKDKAGIVDIAVAGAQWVAEYAAQYPDTHWTFEYSPESFTATELDFAVDICNAVIDVWQPCSDQPVIINLPATVEVSTPNVYADQVEWFGEHINRRDAVIISLHTHNDRGCAVAAAELGLLAGADRIEGTLFGNGERTGNMDIIIMAMNLYSQGIDPQLDFSKMDHIIECATDCTQLPIHPRHPYVGDLVYTAFSGSHQDAINKCLSQQTDEEPWQVAYLPIDPTDLGRSYQEVIRINSQSGKGGVAYIMESEYGFQLPRWLQIDFSAVVQRSAEKSQSELTPEQLWRVFQKRYLSHSSPYQLESYVATYDQQDQVDAKILNEWITTKISGCGNGALAAFVAALSAQTGIDIEVSNYSQHALEVNAKAGGNSGKAAAYVQIRCKDDLHTAVAVHSDILSASFDAVLTAINQYHNRVTPKEVAG